MKRRIGSVRSVAGAWRSPASWRPTSPRMSRRRRHAATTPSICRSPISRSIPGSLFEVPDPAGFTWNATSPGENERLPRAYPIAPPRIPHAIADFLPITLTGNGCLDCHALDAGADAPELPPSHRTDLRNAPDVVGSKVAGARYLCITCHVPTSDAPPARTSRLPEP